MAHQVADAGLVADRFATREKPELLGHANGSTTQICLKVNPQRLAQVDRSTFRSAGFRIQES